MDTSSTGLRIGIDLGGTKIAGIVFDDADTVVAETRGPAPRDDYRATIAAVVDAIGALETQAGGTGTVGIGMPGSISPVTGRVQNSNSVWLNDKPFAEDVQAALGRPARFSNDANCFALSEATDGAAAGADSVFGVIMGTGCGGGVVVGGRIVEGPNRCGGEWGHTPLPWSTAEEHPGPRCWCGRLGCLETWLSGSGLERDFAQATGRALSGPEIAARAADDPACEAALERHVSRLARALAMITNIIDPAVIVFGGGLSQLPHLYARVPPAMAPYVFADKPKIDIRPPAHGDASGVRGAARLWTGEAPSR
ncbi:ROK family protein [Microbaculum marinisediminis]|uniref:ROK family protein n=1 Tax=Microbaculum marinisediminis TaxID=2931392 RepID=A0AAW5QZN8_9HYPH|nr:ROK family protein [Microbaculum sp. A6E488]MCT8973173.1 ROK family protein [Microbaculum sp. A6E488]